MTNKEENGNYNYSIAFMKFFFSFCVVLAHYWIPSDPDSYPSAVMIRMAAVAAPMFFIMSFYLSFDRFETADYHIAKRLWRLYYPQIVWAFAYFGGYYALSCIFRDTGMIIPDVVLYTKKDLLWQLLLGSDRYLCPQFWYQSVLIIITVITYTVYRLSGKHALKIMAVIGIIALILQYSLINFHLFARYEYEIWYPTGRIAESLPFAVMGLLLCRSGILRILKKHWITASLISFSILTLLSYLFIIPRPKYGFDYDGIGLLLYGLFTFLIFGLIPFDKAPEFVKRVLRFLSKYSFGVFCIHLGIGRCWLLILSGYYGMGAITFVDSMIIYAVSLLLAWLISFIPSKYARQAVT